MKRWPTKPLGELVVIEKGKKAPEIFLVPTKTTSRFLQIDDLRPNAGIKYCESFACPKATKADVVLAWDGANAGTVSSNLEGYIGSTLALLRPVNAKNLSASFLSRLIEGKFDFLQKTATGATIPHISKNALITLPVPVPPLAEQEQIVKLLDEADELRKLRSQADRRTADLIPALFHEMFGYPAINLNQWPVRRLEEVVAPGKIVTYGIVQAGPNVPNGIPYIRTGDLKDGVIKIDGLLRTSPEIAAGYRRSEVSVGDIVMSIRATVGTTALVPSNLDGANLTQGTARISPGPDVIGDYLLWFIRAPQTQSWIQAQVKGATFREITLGNLRQLPVLLPPLPMQKEFAQRVTEIRALETAQATSRTRVDALFQSMLHRAFNGNH